MPYTLQAKQAGLYGPTGALRTPHQISSCMKQSGPIYLTEQWQGFLFLYHCLFAPAIYLRAAHPGNWQFPGCARALFICIYSVLSPCWWSSSYKFRVDCQPGRKIDWFVAGHRQLKSYPWCLKWNGKICRAAEKGNQRRIGRQGMQKPRGLHRKSLAGGRKRNEFFL